MNASACLHSCRRGISLSTRTSMGIGGAAERLFIPESPQELRQILLFLRSEGVEPFILGGGCNILFPDHNFNRGVITTEKLRGYSVTGTRVRAEAGVRIETLIRIAIESGLAGLEMFKGIPGTVGGAVAMNAGGSGREFGQLVRTITGIHPETGELVELPASEIAWGYRSAKLNRLVVTAAELELVPGDPSQLRQQAREFIKWKAAHQPLDKASAGCIFRNPPGRQAGALIDQAGLKGARVGGAAVSDRHANFIINERGKATASDVLQLIQVVRDRVQEAFNLRLDLEIILARDSSV